MRKLCKKCVCTRSPALPKGTRTWSREGAAPIAATSPKSARTCSCCSVLPTNAKLQQETPEIFPFCHWNLQKTCLTLLKSLQDFAVQAYSKKSSALSCRLLPGIFSGLSYDDSTMLAWALLANSLCRDQMTGCSFQPLSPWEFTPWNLMWNMSGAAAHLKALFGAPLLDCSMAGTSTARVPLLWCLWDSWPTILVFLSIFGSHLMVPCHSL